MDAGAVEADKDAEVDRGPSGASSMAVGTSSVVISFEELGEDGLMTSVLGIRDTELVVLM